MEHPVFARLGLIAGGEGDTGSIVFEQFKSTSTGIYLSANAYVNHIKRRIYHFNFSSHGP